MPKINTCVKQVWLRPLVQPKVNQGTCVSFFTIPYKTFSSAKHHHSIIALAAVSTSLKIVRSDVENTHTPYLYKRVSDTLTRFSLSYGQLDLLIAPQSNPTLLSLRRPGLNSHHLAVSQSKQEYNTFFLNLIFYSLQKLRKLWGNKDSTPDCCKSTGVFYHSTG